MKGLDYADVMAKAGERGIDADNPVTRIILKETNKINAVLGILRFFKINPAKLIEALLAKVLGGGGEDLAPSVPGVTPAPPPTPPPSPLPVPEPAPTPAGGQLRYEDTEFILAPRYYQPDGNNGRFARQDEFDAVLSGADPMVPGSRFACDTDIFVNGRERFIAPNSEEAHRVLWRQDAPDAPGVDSQRMRYFLEGGDGVVEIHDNQDGFNPYLKVPRGDELEKGRDYQTGRLFGVFTFADGRTKETNRVPSLRVKR